MNHYQAELLVTLAIILPGAGLADEKKLQVDKILDQAEVLVSTSPKKALELVTEAIKIMPNDARSYFCRGGILEGLQKFSEAEKDLNSCIKLDPEMTNAYDLRGSILFKLGKVKESALDFDQVIKNNPNRINGHWQRGISLYYSERFLEGKKQFEGYERVDTNDVENAIWHFLCNARLVGIPQAQREMLKIGKDRRIPMMEIYDLYRGKCKPEVVLEAANQGGGNQNQQLFYANLYLGIYADIEGKKDKAKKHLELAANQYRIQHYMGDVAQVHLEILKKADKENIKSR